MTELAASALLVGVVLAASMNGLAATFRTRQAALQKGYGPRLAEQLLSEIIAMPYKDPQSPSVFGVAAGGPGGQEVGESQDTRAEFDDVDDYDGWSSNWPEDKNGVKTPGLEGWRREVRVTRAERISGGQWSFYDTGLKRIQVKVTSPSGDVTTRSAFRCSRGALEQGVPQRSVLVTGVDARLSLGNSAAPVRATSNLLNHAIDVEDDTL